MQPLAPITTLTSIGGADNAPLQSEVDAAYSVKVFLDNHPGRHRSISILARQSGLTEQRLKFAFEWTFDEHLDNYWAKVQWQELTRV